MDYPFLTEQERRHICMGYGGTLTNDLAMKLWEELLQAKSLEDVISVAERELHARGILRLLYVANGAGTKGNASIDAEFAHNHGKFITDFIYYGHFDIDVNTLAAENRKPVLVWEAGEALGRNRKNLPVDYLSAHREADIFAYEEGGLRHCITFTLRSLTGVGICAIGLATHARHGAREFWDNLEKYGKDWWLISCLINSVIHENGLIGLRFAKIGVNKLQVLWLANSKGETVRSIAETLNIPVKTAESHMSDVISLFKANNRQHAYNKMLEYGVLKHFDFHGMNM